MVDEWWRVELYIDRRWQLIWVVDTRYETRGRRMRMGL